MTDAHEIHLSSTSSRTAEADDIVLRTGEHVRLVFRPTVVQNSNDLAACVRGEFRYQKKLKSDEWDDCETRSLAELTAGDGGFKLELHSGEVQELVDGIQRLRAVYAETGIPMGSEAYTVATGELRDLLRAVAANEDPAALAQLLADSGAAGALGIAAQVSLLEELLSTWRQNLSNGDEHWWQLQFEEHAWVLPQLFAQPFVLMAGQAYLGGKCIDNSGGKVLDIALRNALTDNIALVEIKTPLTPLLGSKTRDDVWAFSSDLSGSITQLLSYKDTVQKDYFSTVTRTRAAGGDEFQVFNPKCVLLVGNIEAQLSGSPQKRRCLDLARNDFRSVEILSFDEMILRLELLLRVLKGEDLSRGANEPGASEAEGAEIPF